MATARDWVEGARLRTLPAAAAPVMVGAAAAFYAGGFSWLRTILALVVALALQVGVNYSNDYSDGIRGADDHRTGPQRLTGGGLAAPKTVLMAALGCFALAGVAGLALVAISGQWILVMFGVLAVVAAWFYTGGTHPYGYMGIGLSELLVFVFFGLFACVGTTWTQIGMAPWWLWILASALGLQSVAMLMVNNIRDIPSDMASGKKTVAVRLGERVSRALYALCLVVPAVLVAVVVPCPVAWRVGAALVLLAAAALPIRPVVRGDTGLALIPALRMTGFYTLGWALITCFLLVAMTMISG